MMRIADRIVMIDFGRVVESGTYDELCDKKGKFAQLVSGGEWMGNSSMTTPIKQASTGGGDQDVFEQTSDLPLRQNLKGDGKEQSVRARWIGARNFDWNAESGPSTGMMSPLASPFSRPSRRREHRADGDV
jgi:ATP-binding cassette subfamily B (MDR/TAP) protein 1